MKDYTHSTAERMMRYAKVDTTSDPNSTSQPSTLKQLDLSKLLVNELKELDILDASLDEYGYVYATLKGNSSKKVLSFAFVRMWTLHLTAVVQM